MIRQVVITRYKKEWVFERKSDGACFTLYDWRSGDENYVNMNTT